MRVLLGANRWVVEAKIWKEDVYTAWVMLTDGKCIKRHKKRDFVDFEADKAKEIKTVLPIKQVHLENRSGSILKKIWVTLVRPIGSDNESPKE